MKDIIVFIDPENETVTIFSEKRNTFDFSEIDKISKIINKKKVIYVTSADVVNGSQIINLIKSTIDEDEYEKEEDQEIELLSLGGNKNGEPYTHVHSTRNGVINVSDKVFKSSTDVRSLDSLGEEFVTSDSQFKKLVNNGILKLLTYREAKVLMEKDKENRLRQYEREKAKDDALDSIIMKDRVGSRVRNGTYTLDDNDNSGVMYVD